MHTKHVGVTLYRLIHDLCCRTPEVLSSVTSLTQLCLNDVAIPRLPSEMGK